MSKPVPTAPQHAAIVKEVNSLTAQQTALVSSAALQDPVIANKQLVDDAFKNLMNWYNDSIIGKYDAERKAITGAYIASPFVEADLTAVSSNPPSGRLTPTPPAQDIVRIPEFDGTAYTSTTTANEQQNITDQGVISTQLQSGVSGGSPTISMTALTTTALSPTSTALSISDTLAITIASGDILVVYGASDAAVVQVTGVTPILTPLPPPYTYNLTVQVVIPSSGTLAVGSHLIGGFSGFTNSERTTKTATNSALQPIMNSLIAKLTTSINDRIARITEEATAISTNDDPYAGTENTTALSNANTSKGFLNTYVATLDISDTGLTSLGTERSARSTYLTSRVSQIINAYTARTENFYQKRYDTANSRGNTYRGTLRALANAQNVKTVCLASAAGLQGSIDALNGIL